jgi:hypothetical protein
MRVGDAHAMTHRGSDATLTITPPVFPSKGASV